MVEAHLPQAGKPLGREPDAGGDQVGVEAGGVRRGGNVHEVAARGRLAAGEMHVQYAEIRRFGEHAGPGCGVEFAGTLLQV